MAPGRKESKKNLREKGKQRAPKKTTKSWHPSTSILLTVSASVVLLGAIYYATKNPFKTGKDFESDTADNTKETGSDPHLNFKVLPRVDGVRVGLFLLT